MNELKIWGILSDKTLIAKCKLLGCYERLIPNELSSRVKGYFESNELEFQVNGMSCYFDKSMNLVNISIPYLFSYTCSYNDLYTLDIIELLNSGFTETHIVGSKRILVNSKMVCVLIFENDLLYGALSCRNNIRYLSCSDNTIRLRNTRGMIYVDIETMEIKIGGVVK